MAERKTVDWELVEREFRAGQLSVAEIGRQCGVSHQAINKRAKREGWTRNLAEKVRVEVAARLVAADVAGRNARETIDSAATRGVEVRLLQRTDIAQLNELKRTLVNRLACILRGEQPDGICLGERESPGDLIEKLSRVTSRLIPLERQAFSLDEPTKLEVTGKDGAPLMDITNEERVLALEILLAKNGAKIVVE